jgi:tetratricopeptide (TPR) repeat protein
MTPEAMEQPEFKAL